MALFDFEDSDQFGKVRSVDTRRVVVQVVSDEALRMARVGQLATIRLPGAIDEWLVALIDKVVKIPVATSSDEIPVEAGAEEDEMGGESIYNATHLSLIGTVGEVADERKFSRSLRQVPEIDSPCYLLKDARLQKFMGILASESEDDDSLGLGVYTIDESAKAFLDGNRFFQRHAALLGSTGAGKSYTLASILEQAAKLPTSNLVLFDLHGEYSLMSYASHLRIPGPEDLECGDDNLLFLPYWLMNTEELQSMFVETSGFTAHNQITKFRDIVVEGKRRTLTECNEPAVLSAFTMDSPIPFSIKSVRDELYRLDTEMVPGKTTLKKGDWNGQFSRFIGRIDSIVADKRYGFMFSGPDAVKKYEYLVKLAERLMGCNGEKHQIKILDFSEVPSDILPAIVGLVARLIFQIQFWTEPEKRQPIAIVCDEAHLYLPRKDGCNPVEARAVENFDRIAKEGRKYGVALLVASQRPSDVSTTILSQCNNVVSMRLTNSDDQNVVKRLMPESLSGLTDVLPILDTGEALVVGDSVLLPSRIKITAPEEPPQSSTRDFWKEWKKATVDVNFAEVVDKLRRQSRKVTS